MADDEPGYTERHVVEESTYPEAALHLSHSKGLGSRPGATGVPHDSTEGALGMVEQWCDTLLLPSLSK